jgi:hypothetical protein
VNLRESMLAAAEDAPLASSTVDIDRIVERERRAIVRRRAGGTAVLGAVLAAALGVPALLGGPGNPATTAATGGPPARPAPPATNAGPVRLTAADLAAAAGLDASTPDASTLDASTLDASASAGLPDVPVAVRIRRDPAGTPQGDPCVLAPGATPGRDGAPTPADRCTKVERNGRTAWIRRWGYSPGQRPSIGPDTVVVEVFFPLRGRPAVLTLGNAGVSPGGPVRIDDATLTEFAGHLLDSFR